VFDLSITTILFQIVNFLVLLAVLSWFFYRPVRKAIEEREREINTRVEQARQREREAEEELQNLNAERERAREEADAILNAARVSAAEERTELIERSHLEADRLRQEALERIQSEEQSMETQLAVELRRTAVSVAGDLIRTAAGPLVHEALVDQFLTSVSILNHNQLDLLRKAMDHASEAIVIETAYPLDEERQDRVQRRLSQILDRDPHDLQLRFEVRPTLIAGVRFIAGTTAFDLSLSHTLEMLSRRATVEESEHELGAAAPD
jgi:F-type H+-transporting ATPase subunit b